MTDLTAADDLFTTDEDTLLTGNVGDNDETTSGGTLTFAETTAPTNGTLNLASDGSFTYDPNSNFNGTDSFTYTVTDTDSGESLTQTVEITVNSVAASVAGRHVFYDNSAFDGNLAGPGSSDDGAIAPSPE